MLLIVDSSKKEDRMYYLNIVYIVCTLTGIFLSRLFFAIKTCFFKECGIFINLIIVYFMNMTLTNN